MTLGTGFEGGVTFVCLLGKSELIPLLNSFIVETDTGSDKSDKIEVESLSISLC